MSKVIKKRNKRESCKKYIPELISNINHLRGWLVKCYTNINLANPDSKPGPQYDSESKFNRQQCN